jgi:hypothetical protein
MLPKGGSGALFYTISSCNTGDLNIAGMSLAVAYLYESERTLGVIANSSATYEPPYYHYYKDIGSPHYLSTGDAFRNFTKSTDYGWNSDHREKIMLFGDPLLKLQRNELWTATPATRVAGWYVASANAKAGEYVVLIGKFNEKDYCPVAFMLGAQDNISGEDYVVCNTIAYGELGDIAIDKFNRVRGRDYPAGHSPFAGDYAVVRIPSNIPPGKYYITARTNGKYTCMKEITVL